MSKPTSVDIHGKELRPGQKIRPLKQPYFFAVPKTSGDVVILGDTLFVDYGDSCVSLTLYRDPTDKFCEVEVI